MCFWFCKKNVLGDVDVLNVDYFSFDGKTFNARVVDVYDGDTFTVVFYYNTEWIKYRCRCLYYDSPEIKPPKNTPNRDDIINQANISKNKLKELLQKNHYVTIKCKKFDKYGRILVEVYNNIDNKSINQTMLDGGYGVPYYGIKNK